MYSYQSRIRYKIVIEEDDQRSPCETHTAIPRRGRSSVRLFDHAQSVWHLATELTAHQHSIIRATIGNHEHLKGAVWNRLAGERV
jgi:hypothetical protein